MTTQRINTDSGIVSIVVTYLLACPLTDKISLDMTQTEWLNIMTYIIWALAGGIWIIGISAVVAVVAWVVSK